MCESRSRTTSWPARVWLTTETRLPIVPDATKRPASLPIRSAATASRRLTVGSSSQTSSPTSARAIALRISGVGSVSVSERRSTMSCKGAYPPLISALGPEPLDGAPAPLGVTVLAREPTEKIDGLGILALVEVHFREQVERLGDHERSRIPFEHQLEPLPRRARQMSIFASASVAYRLSGYSFTSFLNWSSAFCVSPWSCSTGFIWS